ncbi:GNAT family N-acetyltransferase [Ancylobacter defluvii]|uniref:N-acetyltransferase n=1 Tax=Ancylobacter defluvii TaxID=1282440 RepID=A0A9W6N9B5_9HYPH|nr:GNAT family N-acetyltransferase [Ancylobacter defluvii]MBS7587536.1 GNAT family N-acetyltransferase [Ancylobacter defluvii]GLK82226.1 N-acetyltransferase [Ancylobacter defluvii]
MSLTLRPARPEDAALIYSLIRELAEYEQLLHEVEASEADIAAALFGEHPRAFCDIADWNGKPAGLALWFYNFSSFAGRHGIYLEDLFVRPAFRGRGVAKGLMRRLARRCVEEGLGRFEWSVLDWNEPAIRVYRALGARPKSEWTLQSLSGPALRELAGVAKHSEP